MSDEEIRIDEAAHRELLNKTRRRTEPLSADHAHPKPAPRLDVSRIGRMSHYDSREEMADHFRDRRFHGFQTRERRRHNSIR